MRCQKPLHLCGCSDLDERLENLKGAVGTNTVLRIKGERALVNAGRDQPSPSAPKSPVKVVRKEGNSPIATLEINRETKSWLSSQLDSLKPLEEKLPFFAPEHPGLAYYQTKKLLIERLGTGNPVEIWEINRELARKNDALSQAGFGQACRELLE